MSIPVALALMAGTFAIGVWVGITMMSSMMAARRGDTATGSRPDETWEDL